MMRWAVSLGLLAPVMILGLSLPVLADDPTGLDSKAELGQALFFDVNLSRNRTQACATCHDPDFAFSDPRDVPGSGRAVSLGDDGVSLGDRNTPSAAYARFAPPFHRNEEGQFVGGQFWDGRATDLKEQAGGPPLNPLEMGMPDKAAVVERLRENPAYVKAFGALFRAGVLEDSEAGYAAMTESIAAFEDTSVFAPFDSKYDRFLRGEEKLSDQEELGRVLFFSQQFTNCHLCHKLAGDSTAARQETFSNYRYHNIGIPANPAMRAARGDGVGISDPGLLNNPAITDPAEAGKVKVPSLRNVAVTGPYMHNGVFKDLRTTILFYNKYNSKSVKNQTDPETGEPWGPPEVDGNLSLTELEHGPALDDKRIDALVAFLKTLTDRRYEHLLH